MKKIVFLLLFPLYVLAQNESDNISDVPAFYKSQLEDIDNQLKSLKSGKVEIIANSPGGFPVYSVSYGHKNNYHSMANYNSAVGAKNPAYSAIKSKETLPVVYLVGPVHGHEVEGIVGLLNLINIAEKGKDLRGKEWTNLKRNFDQCRVIIIPCGNPDGRKRNPYDSYIGLSETLVRKYGSGTHLDGTIWQWPYSKGLHPMKGDVGILGAYFNNNGINIMHDDFFFPMAEETKAILKIARDEMPDIAVSLHTLQGIPDIWQTNFAPGFIKKRITELTSEVRKRYNELSLPFNSEIHGYNSTEDVEFPPTSSFNLVSALHHVSGATAFLYECTNGIALKSSPNIIPITYDSSLDMELNMLDIVFENAVSKRIFWLPEEKKQ
jgi:hypothetical protein